jgi:beta-phosphoglucomutase
MKSLEIVLELGGVQASDEEREQLAKTKNTWFQEYVEQMAPDEIFPGVKKLIQDFKFSGLKVGLASSSKNAGTVIRRLHIGQEFDAIVDGTMVMHSKPHPEIFLTTADLLGVQPEHCVVFEDAEAGVEAAVAAGMRCVGVGKEAQLKLANRVVARTADFKVDDLTQL